MVRNVLTLLKKFLLTTKKKKKEDQSRDSLYTHVFGLIRKLLFNHVTMTSN